ncbi:hypothetical protein LUZ60_005751 [Juncus effusus]|nr:hypothetical protein LUZ60_005751 [Juncus effusus]
MMLGKRARTSMKKTTSVTELSAMDLTAELKKEPVKVEGGGKNEEATEQGERLADEPPPRSIQRRSSSAADLPAPPHFLAACGLCQRKLGPGVDAFIYRGEVAFCSMECRHYMIREEEQRKKFESWMQTILKFNFQIPSVSSPKSTGLDSTLRSS